MTLFRHLPDGLEIRHRHEVIRIQAWGKDSVRARASVHTIAETDLGALE